MGRNQSNIHEHFTTLPDDRRKCNYCPEQEEHFYKKGMSMSSLWTHLETQRGVQRVESRPEEMPLMPAQQEALNDAFLRWIINDLQPFTMADNTEFIKFVRLLNSCYTLPCHQTVQKRILERFKQSKESIKHTLQDAPGMISLTSDIWTSTASDFYYRITGHFISQD